MKRFLTSMMLFLIVISVAAQPKKAKKASTGIKRTVTAYDMNNHKVQVKLDTKTFEAFTKDVKSDECVTPGTFTITASDAPITLPDPGMGLFHDITNSSKFMISCGSCGLQACVSGDWNPRYFRPREPLVIKFGRCFDQVIGNVRACQTSYGWRVEGDYNKDNDFEAVLKIAINQ